MTAVPRASLVMARAKASHGMRARCFQFPSSVISLPHMRTLSLSLSLSLSLAVSGVIFVSTTTVTEIDSSHSRPASMIFTPSASTSGCLSTRPAPYVALRSPLLPNGSTTTAVPSDGHIHF